MPRAESSTSKRLNLSTLGADLERAARQIDRRRHADILFVLDCTSSMFGELEALKDTILSFTDTIVNAGVQVRVGLIAFRDRLHGEEPEVLDFNGSPFTQDPAQFRCAVAPLQADGGGDLPESSLDAILLALRQPFAPEADKVIVLVTDAPPHVPDKEAPSVDAVAAAVRQAGVRQMYLVIRVQAAENTVYLKLLEGTVGLAFDLGYGDDFRARAENFKRTLQQLGTTISRSTRQF